MEGQTTQSQYKEVFGWKDVATYAKEKGITPQAVYKAVKEDRIQSTKIGSIILVKD